MTRIAYLHTIDHNSPTGEWRVYPCLLMGTYRREVLGKLRTIGQLVYIDDGALRIVEAEDYESRTSATYWVLDTQLATMVAGIEADYAGRKLWRQSLKDVREALAFRKAI